MNLVEVLKKVYLGGINSVCIVEEDLSISVMDETSSILTVVKSTEEEEILEKPIGIRDIGTFISVLSGADADIPFVCSDTELKIVDSDGKVNLKLADVEAIPKISNVKDTANKLNGQLKISAALTNEAIGKVKRKVSQLKPEVMTITLAGKKGKREIDCTLGESIGHRGFVKLSTKVKSKISKAETVYNVRNIIGVFSVIESNKVEIKTGNKLPLMVYEKLDDYEVTWFISPYDFID